MGERLGTRVSPPLPPSPGEVVEVQVTEAREALHGRDERLGEQALRGVLAVPGDVGSRDGALRGLARALVRCPWTGGGGVRGSAAV